MKTGKLPDPNVVHPIAGYDKEIYVKLAVKNPNIAAGVEFVMNGANHQMNEEINSLIPFLTYGDLEQVRTELRARL